MRPAQPHLLCQLTVDAGRFCQLLSLRYYINIRALVDGVS